jgi:ATP-dependent DNA helicase RecG
VLSRIKLNEGWISDTININVCAFSNDIGNTGGGYMIVGDFEQNGVAKRPVQGLPVAEIAEIQ